MWDSVVVLVAAVGRHEAWPRCQRFSTCRSPLSAVLLGRRLAESGLHETWLHVVSRVQEGRPNYLQYLAPPHLHPKVLEAMKECRFQRCKQP